MRRAALILEKVKAADSIVMAAPIRFGVWSSGCQIATECLDAGGLTKNCYCQ